MTSSNSFKQLSISKDTIKDLEDKAMGLEDP